ncbi:MAG: polysaccharide biosynthesis/export family protein [Candidatus Eisenbacteria bacterium]
MRSCTSPSQFVVFVAAFLLASVFCLSPELAPSRGSCNAAEIPEYEIGVEDVLSVAVHERADLSGTFAVGPQGTVVLPLLGETKAAGMAPSQLSREITRKLSVFRVGEALVTVVQYNSRKIFVVGEVVKPGRYNFPSIPSVWQVLSEAGGPTEMALLSSVQVIRAGGTGETVTVDVSRVLSGESLESIKLYPGDTVRVPRKSISAPEGEVVYVLGEVKTPGGYEVAFARDVVAAVSAAGGATDRAELRKVTVVRRTSSATTTMQVNLEKYLKAGFLSANPGLRPGDTVNVPRKTTFWGAMLSPTVMTAFLSAIASIVVITSAR